MVVVDPYLNNTILVLNIVDQGEENASVLSIDLLEASSSLDMVVVDHYLHNATVSFFFLLED